MAFRKKKEPTKIPLSECSVYQLAEIITRGLKAYIIRPILTEYRCVRVSDCSAYECFLVLFGENSSGEEELRLD